MVYLKVSLWIFYKNYSIFTKMPVESKKLKITDVQLREELLRVIILIKLC